MKKLLSIVAGITFGIVTIAVSQSYRGTLSAGPEPTGGFILRSNTAVSWPAQVQANWRYNLGLGEAGILVNSGTPATTAAGTLVMTGSSMQVYLTGSTGLVVKSGTVTTF